MRIVTIFAMLTLVVGLGTGVPGLALAQEAPTGDVLLTVSGTPDGKETRFDLAMLEALPASEFTTKTIWTEGPQRFEGVYLHDLLAGLGVSSGILTLTATNDYAITIPIAEIREGEALLAYRRNGAAMSLRDKGPLWLVYPFDASDDFRNEVIYSRSIWQLDRLRVTP